MSLPSVFQRPARSKHDEETKDVSVAARLAVGRGRTEARCHWRVRELRGGSRRLLVAGRPVRSCWSIRWELLWLVVALREAVFGCCLSTLRWSWRGLGRARCRCGRCRGRRFPSRPPEWRGPRSRRGVWRSGCGISSDPYSRTLISLACLGCGANRGSRVILAAFRKGRRAASRPHASGRAHCPAD